MSNQDLIERYVSEVGRNLPRRMRADVELELRSLLIDSLEERQSDNEDQDVVGELLEEFGPPAAFAAQYLPEKKLVGPKLFPLFKLVLTIVLSVIGGLHLVLAVIALFQGSSPTSVGEIIWWIVERLLNFGESAIYILGIITLTFAILEWFRVGDTTEEDESWDPNELPEVEDQNQIKPFEVVFSIVATVLLLVAINFFPNWLGLIDFAGEEWGIKVLWAEGFYMHIPWLTALWIGEIALKMYVLRYGRWLKMTRGIELALQIFSIFVLYRIMEGPPIIFPEAIDSFVKWGLLVIIVITVIDSVGKLYRLVTPTPAVVVLIDDEDLKSNISNSVG